MTTWRWPGTSSTRSASVPSSSHCSSSIAAFAARTAQRANVRPALAVLIGGLAGTVLIGWLLVWATGGQGRPRSRLWRLISQLLHGNRSQVTAPAPLWVENAVELLAAATLVCAFVMLLRSQRQVAVLALPDELALRELLDENPSDSLGYFALRRDKAVVFSADRRSAVCYRAVAGVALASGDPVVAVARRHRRLPGHGAHLRMDAGGGGRIRGRRHRLAGGRAARDADRRRGDHLAGDLRPGLPRPAFGALGGQPAAKTGLHGAGEAPQQHRTRRAQPSGRARRRLADRWPGARLLDGAVADGRPRWTGTASWSRPCTRPTRHTRPATPAAASPAGLLSFVPWGRDGLSLDVVRHDPRADNGVTELMVAGLMSTGQGAGCTGYH